MNLTKLGMLGVLGIREGQIRVSNICHNAGWYSANGTKIGWGDLNKADLVKIRDSGETLVILGEHDSFWNFVTENPGIIGALCNTSSNEKNPGMKYLGDKCMLIITECVIYGVIDYEDNVEPKEVDWRGVMAIGIDRKRARKIVASFK